MQKWLLGIIVSLLIWIVFLPAFALPIDMTVQDYGRHVQNGLQILAGNTKVLYTNAYSSTYPDFAFTNHHWLTGVLFALVEQLGGPSLVHILHIGLIIALFYLWTVRTREEEISWVIVLAVGLLAGLQFASRFEVRPETFGYVAIALVLWWLRRVERGEHIPVWKDGIWLCLLTILWANMHISFVFGYGLIVLSGVTLYLSDIKRNSNRVKGLLAIGSAMLLSTLITPHGIRGALAPFEIFTNYGYRIVENQSMTFLWGKIQSPWVGLWWWYAGLVILSLVLARKEIVKGDFARAFLGLILSFLALRNAPLLALLTLPMVAIACQQAFNKLTHTFHKNTENVLTMLYISVGTIWLMFFFLIWFGILSPGISAGRMRLGYTQNQLSAGEVLQKLPIQGAMFNNYDIGSYLIRTAWPKYVPFVDNRPEAYPASFFQQELIPMQQDPQRWQQALVKYNFQVIVFGHRDLTEWGQAFVRARLKDPEWIQIYADSAIVIFVRNTPQNVAILTQASWPTARERLE